LVPLPLTVGPILGPIPPLPCVTSLGCGLMWLWLCCLCLPLLLARAVRLRRVFLRRPELVELTRFNGSLQSTPLADWVLPSLSLGLLMDGAAVPFHCFLGPGACRWGCLRSAF
jgi:hypothetical protein